MKTLTIRHLTLGSGQPKITVPLVARDEAALSAALKNLEHACFDIIEFRADYFDQAGNPEYLITQAEAVRRAFPETPAAVHLQTRGGRRRIPLQQSVLFRIAR